MKRLLVLVMWPAFSARAEVTPGELLMAEMNCAACHAAGDAARTRLASRPAPRLGKDGVRAAPQWLRQFLSDPQKTKPGTLMPDMLHALPEEKKAGAVDALTHFLVSIQDPPAKESGATGGANAAAGKERYHALGCVQCHAPFTAPAGREDELAQVAAPSVPLAGPEIAVKYSVAELSRFLADPLKSRPGGRMPSLHLSKEEAESVAAFLLRDQAPAKDAPFVVDTVKAAAGAGLFVEFQCGNCHTGTPNPFTVSNAAPEARKLELLRPRQPSGCLAAKPKDGVPNFALTDRQKTVILAALKSQEVLALPLTEAQQIRRTMTALNCFACHSRDRRGGITGLHREYLGGRQSPPNLNDVGARLKREELREVLDKGRATPTPALRMPAFGTENVAHLPALFEAADAAKK